MDLTLFTVFHVNLAFSAIPPDDVGRVLDRCVWPLIEASEVSGVRLGLEMPVDSLARIAAEDAPLLTALRAGIAAGRLEVLGSGLVQTILPLVPAALNAHNLGVGRERQRHWLGAAPRIGYVPEQTFSAGLVPIFRAAGYEAIVAEWENPASAHGWSEASRYRAAWIEGTAGAQIACLWNSSVLFQRVQRHAHGEIDLEEIVTLITGHGADTPRALCLYGGDAEVFDYRPGEAGMRYAAGVRGEWARLRRLLETLATTPGMRFDLPSGVLASHPPVGPALRLESPAAPVPAKKQAKYNLTRWAVCGRNNVRLNTRCHGLARRLDVADGLVRAGAPRSAVPEGTLARLGDEVLRLWGSDLRTHATEARLADAALRAGAVSAELDALLADLETGLASPGLAADELLLVNPTPDAWMGLPTSVDLAWPPGALRDGVRGEADGHEVPVQAEEIERYRDGSWRRAVLVLAPILPPYGTLRVRLRSAEPPLGAFRAPERIETGATSVVLAPRRGATLRTLGFPGLGNRSLAGTVAQGAFAPIELAADWYTGGFVLWDAHGAKHTDLEPTTLVPVAAPEACPIRVPVAARVAGPWGELWKTVWAYRDVPRVDVRYHLRLVDQRPRSLRLGVLTLDPAAFRPSRLRYATVNGGHEAETFSLASTRVALHEGVAPTVTARGCLGATEGWVDVGDDEKGITVAWDPTVLAAAPLVQHEPAGDRALTRIHLSLAETDDTAAPFWRGHTSVTVSYLGRGADLAVARRLGVAAARGLHVIRPIGPDRRRG